MRSPAGFGFTQAVERALHVEQLPAGHQRVDSRLLERHADRAADGVGLADHVVARHERRAGGGAQEGGEDADQGGLAGAVGAEKAVDLSGVDREVEVVDGADGGAGGAEVADEGGDLDGASSWCCPLPRPHARVRLCNQR